MTADVAVIGFEGLFPGSPDAASLWQNVLDAHNCLTTFGRDELIAAGVSPEDLDDPNYVPVYGYVPDVDCFDAELFGISQREAALIDPQQRLLLETAWRAIEQSGYVPGRDLTDAAVFAGVGFNSYITHCLSQPGVDPFEATIGNDKDFTATRLSYRLGLQGPSVTVQTACSTSLVAVHLACASLLAGECDVAIAGAASFALSKHGYRFVPGGIRSRDGVCRPFDRAASGFVPASGAGVVVLRRLDDAVRLRDPIRAVIRASAVNNDGADRPGFTAPSLAAQAHVVALAQELAEVSPEDVGLIEAHGTATALGDAVEVRALTRAFRRGGSGLQFCALNSTKANIGHLDTAAGVASLIKACFAVESGQIPGVAGFRMANPELDLENSPFYVPTAITPWRAERRLAGVTSLGIGGTNAHILVENYVGPLTEPRESQVVCLQLSGRHQDALDKTSAEIGKSLEDAHPDDVEFTLRVGRAPQPLRCTMLADGPISTTNVASGSFEALDSPQVVFLFAGGGTGIASAGREFYSGLKVFRDSFDQCAGAVRESGGPDIRRLLHGDSDDRLVPSNGLPLLLALQLAFSDVLGSVGVVPTLMIGHSSGEITAAIASRAIDRTLGLRFAVQRAQLLDGLAEHRLASARVSEVELATCVRNWNLNIEVVAVNGPTACTVAGNQHAVSEFLTRCEAAQIRASALPFLASSHSAAVDVVLPKFAELTSRFDFDDPGIPLLSTVSVEFLRRADFESGHWERHLRAPVRFADCLNTAMSDPRNVFVEVGPSGGLTSLARQAEGFRRRTASAVLGTKGDRRELLQSIGDLWSLGVDVSFELFESEAARRVPLPGTPLMRRRFWLGESGASRDPARLTRRNASESVVDGSAVTDAWHAVLGTVPDPDRSFYEDGGTSLVAVQLADLLYQMSGLPVSVRDVLDNPSPSALEQLLRRKVAISSPQAPRAVRLRRQTGPVTHRVACFAPIGGSAALYANLAQSVRSTVDVVGCGFPSQLATSLPSVTSLARAQLEMLTSLDDLPLIFVGWSFGALVAAEAARIYEGPSRRRTKLLLVDPPDPAVKAGAGTDDYASFLEHVCGLWRLEPGIERSEVAIMQALGFTDFVSLRKHLHDSFEAFAWNSAAIRSYDFSPWPPAMIAIAKDRVEGGHWRALCERATVKTVLTDHFGVVDNDSDIAALVDLIHELIERK